MSLAHEVICTKESEKFPGFCAADYRGGPWEGPLCPLPHQSALPPPGSDIIMQLDDVVSSTVTGPRVEEAMHRCVRVCSRVCKGKDLGPVAPVLLPSHLRFCDQGPSYRSVCWLDRCIAAHKHQDKQNLFAIIQGGLNADLRTTCLKGRVRYWQGWSRPRYRMMLWP